MRDSRAYVALILLLVALLVVLYTFVFDKEDYPVNRVMTNRDGKSIEVLIQGKIGNTIHFDRLPGKQRYQINVQELGWKDRIFAFKLRERQPPVVIKNVEKKETDPYIINREKRIVELDIKKQVLVKEIDSRTLSELLQRRREDELKALENDIKELEVAIETYKWRNKK